MTKYNGYTNHETWCVCLWLDNDEGSYNHWKDRATELTEDCDDDEATQAQLTTLADELKNAFVDEYDSLRIPGALADLALNALLQVNWFEVATSRLDE